MSVVLITTEPLQDVPGAHLDLLREAGFEVRYLRKPEMSDEAETVEALRGVAATLAGSEPYSERVLASAAQLRVISRNGVGFDRIDLDAATRRGVAVAITPTGNCEAVAEHAFALLLALAKSIERQNREVRAGVWFRLPLVPLRGRTLGLIGLGRIGRAVALRAAGFRMNVLAFEKYPDADFARSHGIELVNLDTLLERSDFVSLHIPLTDETRGIINSQTLSRMKRGSYLVNTARGGLVVETDLLAALRSGHVAGAGLDVFVHEPTPPDNPLLQFDNVIVSPHIAGVDAQSHVDMAIQAAQNIVDLYRGIWPEGSVVNPAVRSGWKWLP